MNAEVVAYIGLGSNLGDRADHLRGGMAGLSAVPGIIVEAVADAIETAPVGPAGQGAYLNAAARLRTTLGARALLAAMMAVERSRGRDRRLEARWGPRTLDLDLLMFGERVIAEPGLEVPHPRLAERGFVLEPLAAIAPDLVHPVLGRTVRELQAELAARVPAPE